MAKLPEPTTQLPATRPATALILEGNPAAQFAYAQEAARVLMERVEAKPRKIVIGGKHYLEIGDWQTIAAFFGATAGTEWTRRVENDGKIVGYEARAVVHQRGEIISSAEAMCLRSERNWQKREWHALMSMAQTRACAKALRNAFGWVAELRGYAGIAEEMDPDEDEPGAPTKLRTVTGGKSSYPAPKQKLAERLQQEADAEIVEEPTPEDEADANTDELPEEPPEGSAQYWRQRSDAEIKASMVASAREGWMTLKAAFESLPQDLQDKYRPLCNNRWKPIATAIEAAKQPE